MGHVDKRAALPAIELLAVGGATFTDEHAQRLHKLRTLRGLILDCTSVSDEGLAALREALKGTEVYVSQRRAIAAMRKVAVVLEDPTIVPPPLSQLAGDEWFEEAGLVDIFDPFTDADLLHLRMLGQRFALSIRDGTHLTDAGLETISGLSHLDSLTIENFKLGDAGIRHLSGLGGLYFVRLSGTGITDAGLEPFKGLANCENSSSSRPASRRPRAAVAQDMARVGSWGGWLGLEQAGAESQAGLR